MLKIQEQLQKEIEAFQKLQKDLQKLVQGRQQLEAQHTENKIGKDELDLVEEGGNVYKLTGPVLIKQDLSEARMNVQKRIDYIQGEVKRHEKSIKELQEKQEKKRETITKLQQQYQTAIQKQGVKM